MLYVLPFFLHSIVSAGVIVGSSNVVSFSGVEAPSTYFYISSPGYNVSEEVLLVVTTCTVPGSSCIKVLSLGHNKSLDNALWLVVAVCSYLNLGPQAKEAFRWVGLCSRICTSQVGKQEEEHHWWWWERMVRPTSSTNGWWVMSSPAFFFLNFCFCMQQVMIRRRRSGRVVVCNFCLFVIARCVNENTNMQWHVYFFVFLSGFASGGK